MRTLFLILAVAAAIAVPGSALAAGAAAPAIPPPAAVVAVVAASPIAPNVDCGGQSCSGGGLGSTGCWQNTFWNDRGLPYAASLHHYIAINFCKQWGIITSISIAAHGCSTSGFAACSPSDAYLTGGGVGSGYANFVAHANYGLTIPKFLGYNLTDTLNAYVYPG